MQAAVRWLRWVQARQGMRGPGLWLKRMLLGGWKLLRGVPLVNRLRIPVRCDGHRLWVRLFSYDDLLTISEQYEPSLNDLLPPPGGVAVDAGAFIGRHTLAYARAVGPQGRVVAVEALPANVRLLTANVRWNHYPQVACVGCALGRDTRDAWLAYDRETSTASPVYDLPGRVRVRQRSLDDVLHELGIARVDLVKIDVEGAELAVLEGAQATLAASPNARWVIEIHPQPNVPPGSPCPVERWLTERGMLIDHLLDGKRLFYVARCAAG